MELLDFVNDVIYVHIQFAWILFIKKKKRIAFVFSMKTIVSQTLGSNQTIVARNLSIGIRAYPNFSMMILLSFFFFL
jgi:hypothetical protein